MTSKKNINTVWHHASVSKARRNQKNKHLSVMLWFTGLSGSGKSTLAHAVEEALFESGCCTVVLDGDNIRHGLCSDLGFSSSDRKENIRRIGEMGKVFVEAGLITLTAFISPFEEDRSNVRKMLPHGDFLEIYVKCTLSTCEKRDVKGLYKRARAGFVNNFTGISSPYEPPTKPELTIDTDEQSLAESVKTILNLLKSRGIISPTLIIKKN